MDKPENLYRQAIKEIKKNPPDMEKTFRLLLDSYESGGYKAAYALGTWYLHGRHVEKDLSRSIDFFNFAVEGNVSEACYDLAICYEKGNGVKKNLETAFELYVKAALFGDSQSYYEVGRCYYYGIGVRKNERLSNIWLDKAETIGIKETLKSD